MRWLEITTTEMEEARERAAGVALIPIGSIETHGPHLPVGCDALIVGRVADLVAEEEPVMVLPTLPYTWSPQARRHPGAITIEATHLVRFMGDLCDELWRNGFTKIVLLHAHGGNVPLDYLMPVHMVERGKPYALYCIGPWGGLEPGILSRERQRAPIGHAGHVETSSLMYVRQRGQRRTALRGAAGGLRGMTGAGAQDPLEAVSSRSDTTSCLSFADTQHCRCDRIRKEMLSATSLRAPFRTPLRECHIHLSPR